MEKPENRKTDTETRILSAAEEEFLLKGLEGARTTAIAERAGVTHAMLHYYFRTKNMLFEKIISNKMREVGKIILSVFVTEELPLLERIRLGVERHLDFIIANPNLPRFVIQEIYSHPERHRIMQSQISAIAEDMLQNLQRSIDESAARNETDWVDARMLLIDVISLNMFTFISFPLIKPIIGDLAADRDAYFEKRKAENVEIILRRLKKK